MNIGQMIKELNLKEVTKVTDATRAVKGCYIGDLLSLVMSRAQEGEVWITVQTNINIVAVAALTDVACIIIPENIEVDKVTVDKANMQGIAILSSEATSFGLAKKLAEVV